MDRIAWSQGEQLAFPNFGSHHELAPAKWAGVAMFKKALEGGPPVLLGSWSGNLIVPAKSLVNTLKKLLGIREVRVSDRGNKNGEITLSNEEAMMHMNLSEKGQYASVSIATIDEQKYMTAAKLLEKTLAPDDPRKGLVFALAKGMSGYNITRLGAAGTALERGNYTEQVLSDYDHVVSDLNTDKPCGRLIIMAGTPGGGKTFLARALLTQAPKAAFILIPPQMVEDLGGPEILPALTQAKQETSGPIVLVIEDGDHVLVQREKGSMNGISALLNLGDGILGSVLDIRILVTTNAEKLQMDPATRRPGRLCRYLSVEALDPQLATKALQRLTGTKVPPYDEPTTIAEVYLKARGMGWSPEEIVPARPNIRNEILGDPEPSV